jgi:phage tail P2-like protein
MTDASLLPPNSTPLELAIEQAGATRIDGVDSQTVGTLWNAETCPEAFLPYLAWAWSAVSVKRAVIAAAPQVKRLKGTVAAVRQALAAIGARVVISEWWQTGGAPYTATVQIYAQAANGQPQLSQQLVQDLQSALAASAPARAHITTLFGVDFAPVNIAAAATQSFTRRATQATTYPGGPNGALQLGGAILRAFEHVFVETNAALPIAAGQLAGFDPGNIALATVL